jgi:hypothetical protein
MPQRTNEFQKLVHLIEKALAPKGAQVTESVMVEAVGLEKTREVDILIKGDFGDYKMKVAVEVSDDGRKFSLPDFDSLLAKYRGECRLQVDKFVVVTRNGFSDGVIEKAAKVDVELLTLAEAEGKDWSKVGPQTCLLSVPPHICSIQFDPPIETDSPQKLWAEGRTICPHGHDNGTPMERAKKLIFCGWFANDPDFVKDFERQVRESPMGHGFIDAEYEQPGFSVNYQGKSHQISKIKIRVHAVKATGSMECREFRRTSTKGGSRLFRQMKAVAGGKQMSVLMPADRFPEQIVVHFDRAEPTADEKRKIRAARRKESKRQKPKRPKKGK